MRIDLSDVKVGDSVYSAMHGECIVDDFGVRVTTDANYFIRIKKKGETGIIASHRMDGTLFVNSDIPTLFHSIEECVEYFKEVKKQIDSRKKIRYWAWALKSSECENRGLFCYYDDDGYNPDGIKYPDWDDREKIKHEWVFIDV